jgi:hypothetical protein
MESILQEYYNWQKVLRETYLVVVVVVNIDEKFLVVDGNECA